GMRTMRWRAEVNKAQGVDSEIVDPDEIKELVPYIDVSKDTRYPVLGALYHPPGGTIRHDAVVWGYARAAHEMGVHIIQHTDDTRIDINGVKETGLRTSQDNIATETTVKCTAGWSSHIFDMAGVQMPVSTYPL